jgi:hypothetical protein
MLFVGAAVSTVSVALLLRGIWSQFDAAIVGAPGDNLAFVWNTWWAAHREGSIHGLFTTRWLFAPFGVNLVLHTHTLLPSVIAAAVPTGLLAQTNIVVVAHLLLNALCAYALVWQVTRNWTSAMIAALAFAWSPYVGAHLLGHYNLIAGWVLPLFALVLLLALDGNVAWAVPVGLVVAASAYVDYYHFVYSVCLGAVIVTHRSVALVWTSSKSPRWTSRLIRVCAAMLLLDVALIATIAATGGSAIPVGKFLISARGVENPMAVAGCLVMLIAAAIVVPRLRGRVEWVRLTADVRRLAIAAIAAGVGLLPLAIATVALWRNGGYVTQSYFWRSAPPGIDVGTLLLGNPHGALWSQLTPAVYGALGIDPIERTAWLAPALVVLSGVAICRWHDDARVRLWSVVAGVFGLWALGPSLQAFGRNLHVFLPAVLLRYVPLVSNARMPGRAMVLVYLAGAVLAGIGLELLIARKRTALAWALALLLVLDYLPRAPVVYQPDRPSLYDILAARTTEGAVCELPMGLRDGFGETGRMDMRTMWYQTIHGRPMTGGFVARLDPRVKVAYERDPVLGPLLRLSGGMPLALQNTVTPSAAGVSLRAQGIRFLILNRATAPSDLIRYVETGLPLRMLGRESERTLYEVSDIASATR